MTLGGASSNCIQGLAGHVTVQVATAVGHTGGVEVDYRGVRLQLNVGRLCESISRNRHRNLWCRGVEHGRFAECNGRGDPLLSAAGLSIDGDGGSEVEVPRIAAKRVIVLVVFGSQNDSPPARVVNRIQLRGHERNSLTHLRIANCAIRPVVRLALFALRHANLVGVLVSQALGAISDRSLGSSNSACERH